MDWSTNGCQKAGHEADADVGVGANKIAPTVVNASLTVIQRLITFSAP